MSKRISDDEVRAWLATASNWSRGKEPSLRLRQAVKIIDRLIAENQECRRALAACRASTTAMSAADTRLRVGSLCRDRWNQAIDEAFVSAMDVSGIPSTARIALSDRIRSLKRKL